MEFSRICHFKADAVLHTGQLRVVPRQLHSGGVNIAAPDVIMAVEFLIHGLVTGLQPQLGVHVFPLLSGEAAVQAGGPVLGNEGRLDGDGAAAAEGVAQGVPAPIAGQDDHGGGQGLPQGGVHPVGPVAPLVQSRAGGIQKQFKFIVHQGKLQLIQFPGLRQPGDTVFCSQALCCSPLHNGLAVRYRVKLAV